MDASLAPAALPFLGVLVLYGVVAGYFAVRSDKAVGTWWFVVTMGGFAAMAAAFVWGLTTRENPPFIFTWVGPLAGFWGLVGISYRFLGDPYPRESRAVLAAAGAVALVESAAVVAYFVPPRVAWEPTAMLAAAVVMVAFILVAAVVMARRAAGPADGRGWGARLLRPAAPDGRAFRALFALNLLPLVALVFVVLRRLDLLSEVASNQITVLVAALYVLGFVVVYVNAVPQPTTFRVKVVAFALVAVVTALAAAAPIALGALERAGGGGPDAAAALAAAEQWSTLRFATLMLAAAGAVLVAFPLFLREGVTRPLERLLGGVRRVDAGDLGVAVPVRVNDEIGEITGAFNRMARSLQAYAERMEDLVAERTAQLEAAQARLVHAEKMASLGRFTSGVAHEIQNPLNFVTNFAEVSEELVAELADALRGAGDRPAAEVAAELADLLADLEDNAARVRAYGERASGIVAGMLAHARSGPAPHRPTDLGALAEQAAEVARRRYARGETPGRPPQADVALRVEADPALGPVHADPSGIRQVLDALLDNAVYAAAEAAASGRPAEVVVTTRAADGRAELTVRDTGAGIDREARAHAFEPFYTTKPTGRGAIGLGLSLAYDVVTDGHGGTLALADAPGGGTVATVTLPMEPPSAGPEPSGV